MLPVDWLPLRFWLVSVGSISIVILALVALGAIDAGEEDRNAAAVHSQLR